MSAFLIYTIYFSTLIALTVYSMLLSDPHPWYGFGSGSIFSFIVLILTLIYFYVLKNPPKKIWIIILSSAIICFSAFPAALSRDVYNYAMYAKTVVVYHANPWTTPPKAFPNDELLKHIHWPNDPSRYGPTWIFPTTVLYAIFPSLYSFKFFTLICYLACLYIIQKMAGKKALIFVAFNPLMIVEFLVGTHTDIVMTLFALIAIQNKSWLSFLASIGTKITSLPIFLGLIFRHPLVYIWSAYLGSLIIIAKWSINPWYFTLPFILTALYLKSYFHKYLAISLSLAALVRYIPLLYLGPFDPNNKIRAMLFLLFMVPFTLTTLWQVATNIRKQIHDFELGSTC